MIARILKWRFLRAFRRWNAPDDRLTSYEVKWLIAWALFLASPLLLYLGLGHPENVPEWAHGLGFFAGLYCLGFCLVAPWLWLDNPPRIGPNTERCGGEN